VLDEGARTLRRSLQVDLLEPGAEAQLMQVALGRGGQRLDVPSVVRHLSPQTRSTQAFRTAVADSAQAAFRGLVNIALDAQQVSAKQMSRALLLGGGAQAILKPQLMILADDVKCQHGATVGQLDEDAMFYLVSRGIDAATARQMLTYAFLADAFSEAPPTLGAALMARACAWLGLDPSISSIRIPEAP
jgi:Fe-S cluster assembly protein SufD